MLEETPMVIDLKVNKWLVTLVGTLAVMLLLLFLKLLAKDSIVTASEASATQSGEMRQFYLSNHSFDGDAVLAVCAQGYHMASLWEIADPTNFKYDTSLGRAATDSGQGPPSNQMGWVRTGYLENDSSTPGRGNCNVWADLNGSGTVVNLLDYWTSGGQDIGVWNVGTAGCELSRSVWCVED